MDLDICKASLIRSDWGSSKISEIKWRTWSVESKCGCLYVSNQQQSKANTAYKSGLTQSKNAFLSRVNDPESKSTKSSTSSSSLLLPECLLLPLDSECESSSCSQIGGVFVRLARFSFQFSSSSKNTPHLSPFCIILFCIRTGLNTGAPPLPLRPWLL